VAGNGLEQVRTVGRLRSLGIDAREIQLRFAAGQNHAQKHATQVAWGKERHLNAENPA